MSELDDLNELIAAGEEAVKTLKERRDQILLGVMAVTEDTVKSLARLLHGKECRLSHEDMCSWEYEEEWIKRGASPMGETPEEVWTSSRRAHSKWLERAKNQIALSGQLPEVALENERNRP